MSKEAEILKTGISYHYTLLPKIKQINGGHVSQVSLKLSDYGQSYLFN